MVNSRAFVARRNLPGNKTTVQKFKPVRPAYGGTHYSSSLQNGKNETVSQWSVEIDSYLHDNINTNKVDVKGLENKVKKFQNQYNLILLDPSKERSLSPKDRRDIEKARNSS